MKSSSWHYFHPERHNYETRVSFLCSCWLPKRIFYCRKPGIFCLQISTKYVRYHLARNTFNSLPEKNSGIISTLFYWFSYNITQYLKNVLQVFCEPFDKLCHLDKMLSFFVPLVCVINILNICPCLQALLWLCGRKRRRSFRPAAPRWSATVVSLWWEHRWTSAK